MSKKRRDVFIGSAGPHDQPAFFSASMENNMYRLKVVLIGDISVGKTSLAIRFAKNKFEETYKQTIGASFIAKVAHVIDDVISFQIWDTAGQERYKSLVPMYLRGAHIALLLYDVTDPSTFENVNVWLDALRQHGDFVKTVLVCNKCDLEPVVEDEEAEAYASDNGLKFMRVSAKSGYNVDQVFHMMGSMVVEEMREAERQERQDRAGDQGGVTMARRPSRRDTITLASTGRQRRMGCCNRTRTR